MDQPDQDLHSSGIGSPTESWTDNIAPSLGASEPTARLARDPKQDIEIGVSLFARVDSTAKPSFRIELWDLFCERVAHNPPQAKSKRDLPLLTLVQFGDVRNAVNDVKPASYRHNRNVLALYGVVVEHDAETVTIEEAVKRLKDNRIAALVHASPSHMRETFEDGKPKSLGGPRWRAIFPTSQRLNYGHHFDLVSRANGALGGCLAAESWDLSRAYYYGKVDGGNYGVARVDGRPIDLCNEIRPIGKPSSLSNGGSRLNPADDAVQTELSEHRMADDIAAFSPRRMSELESATMYVASKCPPDDYDEYIAEYGLALACLKGTPFEQSAKELFHRASALSKKYDKNDAEYRWGTLNPTTKSYRSIFDRAYGLGWKTPRPKKPGHDDIAQSVIDRFGTGNLVFADGLNWLWSSQGVWDAIDDQVVKKSVIDVLREEYSDTHTVTSNLVTSVFSCLKTMCFIAGVFSLGAAKDVIAVANGELHLRNAEWVLQPAKRESYCVAQLPVPYTPEAKCPLWSRFVAEIFEGDPDAAEKTAILQEAFGYSLLTDSRFEKFLMLVGNGANGKSVVLAVLAQLVGRARVSAVQPSQFGNRFQRAHMRGKLVNIVTEIAQGAQIADAELKAIVSGELMTAEVKMKDPFEFTPYCTCWFATNHMPSTRDFSDALFRRALILTFNRRFDGPGCDPDLKSKLCGELPGILAWALRGLSRLFAQRGFTESESNQAAKAAWALESNPVAQFVEERCVLDPTAEVASGQLYQEYRVWAQETGSVHLLKQVTLTQRLSAFGVKAAKAAGGRRVLRGIRERFENDDHIEPLV